MVLSFDRETKKVIASISNEGSIEKYECIVSACKDPLCECGSVYLEFNPIEGETEGCRILIPHAASINLNKKVLEYKGKGATPTADQVFAERLFTQLGNEDCMLLNKLEFGFKNRITNASSADSLDVDFDYTEVEEEGYMLAYNDVLPYADQLLISIEDKEYMFIDQFCAKPRCSCTDVFLSLLFIDSESKTGDELCSFWVDYKKRKWSRDESSPSSFSSDELKSAIKTQIPDFYEKLRARHIRLKAIYAHCRKRHFGFKEPLQLPKVGRNDPCPCGSEKKYKKCGLGKTG